MIKFNDSRNKKVYEIVSIVKLFSLLICAIIMFSEQHQFTGVYLTKASSYSLVVVMIIAISVFVIVYKVWLFSVRRLHINKDILAWDIAEIFVSLLWLSFLIYITGAHTSQYKFLYLFIIVTSTIQFGMRCGFTVACISSGIVLLIDLIKAPDLLVNKYFETDLILVGIFILTA